jgi:hypothetical protein
VEGGWQVPPVQICEQQSVPAVQVPPFALQVGPPSPAVVPPSPLVVPPSPEPCGYWQA